MKNLLKFFVLAIVGFAFSSSAFGQASATSTAAATIVSPIGISNTVVMNFGNIAAGTGGTVVLPPTGARTITGGVTLPAVTGSPAAASFTVTGTAGYTYAITLPSTATTIATGGGATMSVNNFTHSYGAGNGTVDGTPLTVGATLNVANGQAAGVYSSQTAGGSGPFTVQVNYN